MVQIHPPQPILNGIEVKRLRCLPVTELGAGSTPVSPAFFYQYVTSLNQKTMKKLIQIVAGAYLGFCLGAFCGMSLNMWQYWATIVPTIFLYLYAADIEDEE